MAIVLRLSKRLYRDGESVRLGLPKIWTTSIGLSPGDEVEIAFNEAALVVIPRKSTGSERVLKAMRGAG